MQDLTNLIREFCDYYFTRVHTSIPGVVLEYNANTRRAVLQPSLNRRAGNKEFVPLPILVDVPVQFPGTKKYSIHFPLEKDDEVSIFFSERSIEEWKAAGQDGIEDADPRRFSLSDAYCIPGLQPQEFVDTPKDGLIIKHKTAWNGNFISHIYMNDNKIEIKYKKKCKVTMTDDKIEHETEHNYFFMTKKQIKAINSISIFEMDKDVVKISTGKFIVEATESADVKAGGNITTIAGGINLSVGASVLHK